MPIQRSQCLDTTLPAPARRDVGGDVKALRPETLQTDADGLWWPAPLPSGKGAELIAACREIGIPDDDVREIEWQTRLLAQFEKVDKARIKTPAQRRKSLEKISRAAKDLADALGEMESVDLVGLRVLLHARSPDDHWHEGPAPGEKWPTLAGSLDRLEKDSRVLGVVARELSSSNPNAESALRWEAWQQGASQQKTGRRPMVDRYVEFVGAIWACVEASGVKLERGGTFARVCEAVYMASGVHADPDGHIRAFISSRGENTLKKGAFSP
jgi:hypothetical protein